MSKHKKTRKEKIIADYRHQVYILENKNIAVNSSAIPKAVNENSYFNTYILKDVLKTGILTCSIIAMEVVFFFLLKKHLFLIPNLNY